MDNRLIFGLIGMAISAIVIFTFFWPDVEVEYIREKEYIDTSYVDHSETVKFDSTIIETLGDSIEHYKTLYEKELSDKGITIIEEGPYSAPLRRFKGLEPTLYGDIGYNALIAGDLLDMSITQNLKLPVINHRIEREIKTVVHTKGLFVGAGLNTALNYHFSADYVSRDFLTGYYYDPVSKTHGIRIAKKIF